MSKTLESDLTSGELTEIQNGTFTDPTSGRTSDYKNALVLVGHADRTRTKERIKLPLTFQESQLKVGHTYTFPVELRVSRDKKLGRTLREDLPILPAPAIEE